MYFKNATKLALIFGMPKQLRIFFCFIWFFPVIWPRFGHFLHQTPLFLPRCGYRGPIRYIFPALRHVAAVAPEPDGEHVRLRLCAGSGSTKENGRQPRGQRPSVMRKLC